MPKFSSEFESPYTAQQLMQLVMDVESYPEFIPWCMASRVVESQGNITFADMVISFKSFIETYRSKIEIIRNDGEVIEILVQAIDGPFKYLENSWHIVQHKNNSVIHFAVDFSFKSSILNNLIGAVFENATRRVVLAFEQRAEDLFGCKEQ